MKKKLSIKQENGITIVALVITIIILLILAGVSMVMLIGKNSIIEKGFEAKNETNKAKNKEQEMLESYSNTIDTIINDTITSNTSGNVESKIYTIPAITNTNDPSVFASGYFNHANGYTPSRAFDKITTGGNVQNGFNDSPWAQEKSGDVFVGYAYGIPVTVYKAEYTPRYDQTALTQNLHEYKYQYSDDFNTWKDATDIIVLDTYNFTEPVVTEIKDKGAHRFWRLYVISNHGSRYTAVNELQFYCTI